MCPLIRALQDCMGEVVNRAKQSLAFVLLQELAAGLPQGLMLTLRRDVVFSQAVGASCRAARGRAARAAPVRVCANRWPRL